MVVAPILAARLDGRSVGSLFIHYHTFVYLCMLFFEMAEVGRAGRKLSAKWTLGCSSCISRKKPNNEQELSLTDMFGIR